MSSHLTRIVVYALALSLTIFFPLIVCFIIFDVVDDEGLSSNSSESQASKETIDLKEVKRIDHILASLHRKAAI